jgi:hypothetical protein
MTEINVVVSVGGSGSRLKCLSNLEKQNLYFWDKTIIDWIGTIYPNHYTIGVNKTKSRRETLNEIRSWNNVLLFDCDIIPFGMPELSFKTDEVVCFTSTKKKYGSVKIENGLVVESTEKQSTWENKLSGAYFIKSVSKLLERMSDDNSVISGMDKPKVYFEDTFVRLGDREDYLEAIKKEI